MGLRAVLIAEMDVDSVRKRTENTAKKSSSQTDCIDVDETGKDGLLLDQQSIYVTSKFYSHLTTIFHCC